MPDAHPLQPGDPAGLGGYEILGRLGEGGQGTVFLGRRAGDEQAEPVAIKLLHAGLRADDPARARFVRELDVAKRVARFCTAQVLDADLAGDQPYIVSEYVPGQSLHRLVQAEGPRTGGALERLAMSTLTALYAIHQAGIVHRDFKPQNVMMGPDGPRVIDFGVARALGAAGETQNVGTPAYMAPEHFTGGAIGPAADMFAWGTTMVYAATGRPAFGNDEMAAVMHRIITFDPDLGDLPSPLREVVAACLDKEPGRRPTAREAQERLVGASGGALPDPAAFAPSPAPAAFAPPPAPVQNAFPSPPFAPAPSGPQGGPEPGGRGTTAPQPHGPLGTERRGRGRMVIPIIAAAATAALLAGGSVWAATRSGGDGPERAEAGSTGGQDATAPQENAAGGDADHLPGDPRTSRAPGEKPKGTTAPQRPGGGQSSTPGGGGGGGTGGGDNGGGGGGSGGGGEPAPEPAQKYTATQVCGSGYYVQRSMAVAGGRVYQLYSNGTKKNCAVMLKSKNVGRPTSVSVWIQAQGGSRVTDSGSFSWYAGPVYVYAPGKCVRVGSGSYTSSYANCG